MPTVIVGVEEETDITRVPREPRRRRRRGRERRSGRRRRRRRGRSFSLRKMGLCSTPMVTDHMLVSRGPWVLVRDFYFIIHIVILPLLLV